jgi:peptidoglycan/LPS O-acetylase OafA/YrhL
VLAHANGLFKSYNDHTSSYLVVDFFWILSGLVIAYAYGKRLDEGLPWLGFMRLRLLRLYPMLFAGVIVAGVVFVGRQILLHTGLVGEAVVLTALSLTLLPVGLLYGMSSYPVDNPVWSLFFEFVANAVYASPVRKFGRALTITLLILAIVALTILAVSFGTVSDIGYVGPTSFLAGFVRVAVPFSLGVVIWQLKLFTKFPSVPISVVGLGLACALFLHTGTAWIYDLPGVLIIFPALVCLGTKAKVSEPARKICNIAKRGSYPLYVLHMSVLRTVDMGFKMTHIKISPFVPMTFGVLLSLVVSWAFLRLYDEPVRRWMSRRYSGNRAVIGRAVAT